MQILLAGDLHLSHKNILKYRTGLNLSTVEEHDEFVVENILKNARKRDHLILLGDCFFNDNSLKHLHKICNRYAVVKIVLGNHCFQYCKNYSNAMLNLLQQHDNLSFHGMIKYKHSWLTHAPIHENELRNKINIHGHVHTSIIQDWRYVNLSIDNTEFKPVNFQEIIKGYRGTLFDYSIPMPEYKG